MNQERTRSIKLVSRFCAALVITLASAVFVGWAWDLVVLKSIHPAWASMKPNTAFAHLLSALCLWLLAGQQTKFSKTVVFLSSVLVSTIGCLTLLEYICGVDLGIDQLLFNDDALATRTSHPARMGPNTAFSFFLLGLAICFGESRRQVLRALAYVMTGVVFLISFLGIVGYVCEISTLYGISSFTSMALHTAMAFVVLCVGCFALQTENPITNVITSSGSGGQMLRRWLPFAVLVPLGVARACLSFIQHGYLNLETWVALGVTPVIVFIALAFFRYGQLADRLDSDRAHVSKKLEQKHLEVRYNLSTAIDHFLATAPETDEAFSKILEIACTHLGWKHAAFWSVDKPRNVLVFESSWSAEPENTVEFTQVSKDSIFKPGTGLPGRVWQTRTSHWISDVTKDDNFPRFRQAIASGLRGAFGFPLVIGSEILGVIEVFSSEVEQPNGYLLANCQTMSGHIGHYFQKRQMARTLREERDFSNTLIESSLDGIFAFDTALRYRAWNKAMETLTGIPPTKALGKVATKLFPQIVATPIEETYWKVLAGDKIYTQEKEFTYLTTQEQGFYEANWAPLYGNTGDIIGGLCVVRDVTRRKRAERELRERESMMIHSSRMAALGEMAGGVAHEINNPLLIINFQANIIKNFLERDDVDAKRVRTAALSIEETVFRISRIINGLLLFSSGDKTTDFRKEPVNAIVHNTLSLCRERFKKEGIRFEAATEYGSLAIECRSQQICQVLLNLLNNAFDAIQAQDERWIEMRVTERDDVVEFSVQDNGSGIDATIRDKIMQPFFTTKEVGKGTGLGLSISKGIVEAHQGSIELDASSKYTQFIVRLPKAQNTDNRTS